MNKEIKQKWIEALRNGKYEQGLGSLRHKKTDEDCKYCCLGVLGDILGPDQWHKSLDNSFYLYGPEEHSGRLPPEVFELTELDDDAQDEFISMNDADGLTFDQIAEIIEKDF